MKSDAKSDLKREGWRGLKLEALATVSALLGCDRTHYTTDGISGAEPWTIGSVIAAVAMTTILVGGLIVLPIWYAYRTQAPDKDARNRPR